MGFKFSLATVLQVRKIREEREERMLQQILFEIAQSMRMMEQFDAEIAQVSAGRLNNEFASVHGSDVHASYGKLASLQHSKSELQAHIEKLEQLRLMQIGVFESARRDRETLTDMRAEQRDEYWANVAKCEQKTLDDIFGARQKRA